MAKVRCEIVDGITFKCAYDLLRQGMIFMRESWVGDDRAVTHFFVPDRDFDSELTQRLIHNPTNSDFETLFALHHTETK